MCKLHSCTTNGHHEVVNISLLTLDDECDKILMASGYRYRGTCTICNNSILAKNIEEYTQFK